MVTLNKNMKGHSLTVNEVDTLLQIRREKRLQTGTNKNSQNIKRRKICA